jgi:predicted RNase H-like HicB family nuclease
MNVEEVPGVVALGATRDEVADRIQKALDAYSHEMATLGQSLPTPNAATATIRAA